MINGSTKLCAIIGNPVSHSLSPLIHNAAFKAKKMNMVYTAFCVSDVEQAVAGVRGLGIQGLSVTIPHKETIIPYLDVVENLALKMGAVNTVLNQDGKLFGYNTDLAGIEQALGESSIGFDETVVIFGAGGAARAATFLASQKAAKRIVIFSRGARSATRLQNEIKDKTGFDNIFAYDIAGAEVQSILQEPALIINGTPLGMKSSIEAAPFDLSLLNENHAVLEMIYTPIETKLIKVAREKGCLVATGDRMFLKQAEEQFKIWTEQNPPDCMEDVFYNHLKK